MPRGRRWNKKVGAFFDPMEGVPLNSGDPEDIYLASNARPSTKTMLSSSNRLGDVYLNPTTAALRSAKERRKAG